MNTNNASNNSIHDAVSSLPFTSMLTAEQRDYLERNAVIRKYAKGEIVHGGGRSCLGMVFVVRGDLRVFLLSEEGREVTLYKIGTGETCVLSASCVLSQITFETEITAEKDTEILVVNSAAVDYIMQENIRVRCFFYELAMERFSAVMWTMQQILFEKMDRRLGTFLADECERTGKSEIRMTQEQIAVQISSAREVVARMLKRFASDGLVELKRGAIIVKDCEALREL